MLRKLAHIIVWLLVLAYLGTSLAFTERMDKLRTVSYIEVELMDSLESQMVSKDDVLTQINRFGYNVIGIQIDSINISGIEDAVSDISGVKSASVYYTPDEILHIRIWQRKPIARIIAGRSQYYLDEEGKIIQFNDRFTPKVLVITGNINPEFALDNLHDLSVFIREDPFIDALVQGIHVDQKMNLEIIPRLGSHRIFFGSVDDYEWKFEKLRAFYKNALPKIGWDIYSSIDLRYSNQVVCKKIDLVTN